MVERLTHFPKFKGSFTTTGAGRKEANITTKFDPKIVCLCFQTLTTVQANEKTDYLKTFQGKWGEKRFYSKNRQ